MAQFEELYKRTISLINEAETICKNKMRRQIALVTNCYQSYLVSINNVLP